MQMVKAEEEEKEEE